MITPGWIEEQRRRIAAADNAGNMVTLPAGGGALTEALAEIEKQRRELDECCEKFDTMWQRACEAESRVILLRTILRALYGTVCMQKKWREKWPVIDHNVKEALGQ